MKKCNKCGELKDLVYFHRRKDSNDGYRNQCKECWRKKTQRYYEQNKEKILEGRKEYSKKYYKENKEEISKKSKHWRDENKE